AFFEQAVAASAANGELVLAYGPFHVLRANAGQIDLHEPTTTSAINIDRRLPGVLANRLGHWQKERQEAEGVAGHVRPSQWAKGRYTSSSSATAIAAESIMKRY